jgi:hypothetical protein
MDWLTGAMTVLAMELIGRKYWQGWLVGLVNQFFWLYLIIELSGGEYENPSGSCTIHRIHASPDCNSGQTSAES